MCLLGLIGSNQPDRKMITGSVGELLKLDCGEYSTLPSSTVRWNKFDCDTNQQQRSLGENIIFSLEPENLYIRSLTSSHTGCFQCTVRNSVSGSSLEGSYRLIVNGKFASFSVYNFY